MKLDAVPERTAGMANRSTADMLRAEDACNEQVEEFERRFPNGVVFVPKEVEE